MNRNIENEDGADLGVFYSFLFHLLCRKFDTFQFVLFLLCFFLIHILCTQNFQLNSITKIDCLQKKHYSSLQWCILKKIK